MLVALSVEAPNKLTAMAKHRQAKPSAGKGVRKRPASKKQTASRWKGSRIYFGGRRITAPSDEEERKQFLAALQQKLDDGGQGNLCPSMIQAARRESSLCTHGGIRKGDAKKGHTPAGTSRVPLLTQPGRNPEQSSSSKAPLEPPLLLKLVSQFDWMRNTLEEKYILGKALG